MLSAFHARPIIELKQRDKSKIESILAYGDRLLVGLYSGSLRIYRVNEPSDEPSASNGPNSTSAEDQTQPKSPTKVRPVDLLREEEKFSRRPVQQLAIIKEANILVSLSDSYVSIHDLQNYTLQEKLEKTRGATSFAVTSNIVKDPSTGIPSIVSRLAVAVKRKIILWSWQDMELASATAEMALMATVKSLTWATGTKLVAGMDPGFVMVNTETKEVSDINKPGSAADAGGQAGARFGAVNSSGMGYMGMGGWIPKPLATRLSEGQLLLAKDVNTLFIDTDGKALEKRQIPWALAPEAIGYSYPYMLALQSQSKGVLEVRNPDTLSLLQSISLPNATFLHVPQPNISLAHAGKGFLVASDRCVWRMGALDYNTQIDELLAKSRYEEAISLLVMLEDTLLKDKEGRLREIKMLKAQSLFNQRRYREALDLFSEASAPPERVISLYPKSVAGDLSIIEEKDSGSDVEQEEANGNTTELDGTSDKAPPATLGKSMLGKLKGGHKRIDSDIASIRSVRMDNDNTSVRGKPTEPDKALEGKDLIVAVNELCAFLAQTRVQLKKFINTDGTLKEPLPPPSNGRKEHLKPAFQYLIMPPSNPEDVDSDWAEKLRETAVLVDTTLFRAYMLARPGLAGSLFRIDNFCDPRVVNDKLYESGRYADLIDFLHGKKLHREALELLEKFGKNEADDEVTPALRGPTRTVGYLQQLPPEMIDLILEFAEWPIRTDPDLGMEIFLADTENAEHLPRHRVLDFLQPLDPKLAVKYLEHIISELNDQTPDFHQRLIDLYLDKLKAHDFENDDERAQWRERLQAFLKSSAQYNRARAFRQLPTEDPDFYESRAIVLSAMGQHKQALQIYVFQLADPAKAEDYCNQVYLSTSLNANAPPQHTSYSFSSRPPPNSRQNTASYPAYPANTSSAVSTPKSERDRLNFPAFDPEDAQPGIYHTLLSLYLAPPAPHKPAWPPALDLLSKHGARLPASSTLDLIPASLPIRELESYFRGRIRSANSVVREERVTASLRAVEKVAAEAELLLGKQGSGRGGGGGGGGGRSRRVVVREEDHCRVCHKRFGGSAIRAYPDGEVVHYGCFDKAKAGPNEGVKRVGPGVGVVGRAGAWG